MLYCRGYQIQTIVLASLPDSTARRFQADLKSVRAINFRGVVRGLVIQNALTLHLSIRYMPWWTCEFFHLADCALGGWEVGSVALDAFGGFATTIPDFAADPSISSLSMSMLGELSFRILDQKTKNTIFTVYPASGLSRTIPVAPAYDDQLFDANLP